MSGVQAPYFEAVERMGLFRVDHTAPAGYERNYRRGRLVVTVCPWHWRAYSHYQFWELLAAAHIAKLAGARRTALVTNREWTEWCWEGFAATFDDVIVAEASGGAADSLARLVARRRPAGRPVPAPPAGRVFFGAVRRTASTVALKASLAAGLEAVGERPDRPGRVRAAIPGPRDVGFHHRLANGWVVHAKGFRNPDPTHELKMLAGRAFAVGPEQAARILYVVDGRVTAEGAEIVARAGAHVTTPDRYREAALALWRRGSTADDTDDAENRR